jgi:tetratricopeptide (TPR) repeat protein
MKRLKIILLCVMHALLGAMPVCLMGVSDDEALVRGLPPDTAKVRLLLRLGEYYCGDDFEKALVYLQEALVLSTELNYKKGIAQSFLLHGRAYYYKDDYRLATDYLEKAQRFFKELEDDEGQAQYYLAAGHIKDIRGNQLHAIQDFQKAVALSRISGNRNLESYAFNSIGNLSLTRNENELALHYFDEALTIAGELADQGSAATVLTNIGRVYENMGLLDSALIFMNKGLAIREGLGYRRGVASSGIVTGNLLIKMQRYREAVDLLGEAQDIYTALNDDAGICYALKRKANALNFLGNKEMAMTDAGNALFLARKIKNPTLLSSTYSTLADMSAHNGDFENAYHYTVLRNRLQDSLANDNKDRIIKELEIQFQTARKDDTINLLQQQNEIQQKNNILLMVSFAALAIILVLTLISFRFKALALKRQKKLYEQENTIRNQENALREKEQQMLKEDLEARNREMASKALEMLRVNETIESIIEKLGEFNDSNHENENLSKSLQSIVSELESQLKNNSWNEFERIFNNIHSDFFIKLLETCPNLTPAEIKIAALLKLNLNTKEMAALTYKSESGIKSTRFRLRKKLGLNSDDSLVPYLMQL